MKQTLFKINSIRTTKMNWPRIFRKVNWRFFLFNITILHSFKIVDMNSFLRVDVLSSKTVFTKIRTD